MRSALPSTCARVILGVPPGELTDRHVDLEALWGRRARDLRERLCAATTTHQRFAILEAELASRLDQRHVHPAITYALDELARPEARVGQIAKSGVGGQVNIFQAHSRARRLAVPMLSVIVSPAAVSGVTAGRAQSLLGLAMGLISVVVGARAGARRGRATVALVAGLIGVVWSGVRLANSGPIGSGGGRLGAIVALAVALIGAVVAVRALARARRST